MPCVYFPCVFHTNPMFKTGSGGFATKIKEIDRQIAEFNNKNLVLARLNTKGIIRPTEYAEQSSKIKPTSQ